MKKPPIAAIITFTLAIPPARAEFLVCEPFDYDVGALTGKNGGLGFAAGWLNSNGANESGYVWDETTHTTFDNATLNGMARPQWRAGNPGQLRTPPARSPIPLFFSGGRFVDHRRRGKLVKW